MDKGAYDVSLAEIERRNPHEPLLGTLRRGYSRGNVFFLKIALERMPPDEEPDQEADDVADEVLRGLWSERSRLFGLMNKQSNRFHNCKTTEERRANSQKIRRFWDMICAVKKQIEYYKAHGELPDAAVVDDLPDNPVALGKKINSMRSIVSIAKSELRRLATDGGDAERIAELEARIKKYQHLIGLADQKMKTYA